jgi:hypothetical protein
MVSLTKKPKYTNIIKMTTEFKRWLRPGLLPRSKRDLQEYHSLEEINEGIHVIGELAEVKITNHSRAGSLSFVKIEPNTHILPQENSLLILRLSLYQFLKKIVPEKLSASELLNITNFLELASTPILIIANPDLNSPYTETISLVGDNGNGIVEKFAIRKYKT